MEEENPPVTKEKNPLVERLGKGKVRAIAAVGLAAAGFLGISGKPDSGIGTAVQVTNPFTGKQELVGVSVSSTIDRYPLGVPREIRQSENLEAFQVSIGGAKLTVYTGEYIEKESIIKTILGIYPAAESRLGER